MNLPPEPEHARTSAAKIATVAALGVGALAGVGVGIGFGLASKQKADEINGGEGCGQPSTSVACQRLDYDISVQHREEWAMIGGYIGAVVLGGAGVATWFLWPRAPVQVSAGVGDGSAVASVSGRW